MSPPEVRDKTPVTLLTGFLGAGKTTLLNHILSNTDGVRYAVIVNEFAELGIDADLVVNQDEDVMELNNGCICCSVRHELTPVLARLAREGKYDAILIETTGLAAPQPIMAAFAADPEVATVARLNSVITVVDGRTLADRLADSPEARDQIVFADHILLNKTDLVEPAALDAATATLRGLNPIAAIYRTLNAQAPLHTILSDQASDLDRLALARGDELNPARGEPGHQHDDACDHDHDHDHDHGHVHLHGRGGVDEITSVALSLDRPLDAMKVTQWLDRVLAEQGVDILRAKGLLDVKDEPRRIVMQIVAGTLDGEARQPWPADQPRISRLVFIGRRLQPAALKAAFEAAAA